MDENKLKNTYILKVRQGIDDLMGVTNGYGEFVGCSIIGNEEEYFRRHEYYDNLIKAKNEEYIKLLLEKNEYGKEIEIDLTLTHNPLFDGPSPPKPIEEFHPSESYRVVFLDATETPEEDKKLQQEASGRFENTEITYYEFPDERTGKVFRSNSIKHLIDQIVAANNEDQYVRWSLENWTKEDWEKHRVTKKAVNYNHINFNQMTQEEQIKHVKQLRVSIDKNIQEVKEFQDVKLMSGYRELALVVTKLQEAKMWLGQVLAEIGATTPYPHADNPANSIVSPTADVYGSEGNHSNGELKEMQNNFENPATDSPAKYPLVSIHFTIKEQSFESLELLLAKLVTTWRPTFKFNGPTKVLHSFMPLELVKEKGYSTELYDRLLNPYFGNQECLFREGDLQRSRENVLSRVKDANGYAIFIGDIKEGVEVEYNLAKELGVQILHLPHID